MSNPFFLQNLQQALQMSKVIPLFGKAPPFPWEAFAKELSSTFDIQDFTLKAHSAQWLPFSELLIGLGEHPALQPFQLEPLVGTFFWVMSKQTKKELVQCLLSNESTEKGFSEPSLQEGFTHFIYLNVLDIFNQLNPYQGLRASLQKDTPLEQVGALTIDIAITLGKKNLWARLLCPPAIYKNFVSHFAMESPPLLTESSAKMLLTLIFEVGRTTLSIADWETVKVGDFILLDRCTFDIRAKKGTGRLLLGKTALFDIRIKDSEAKILEYAFTQEDTNMKDSTNDSDFDSEEFVEEDADSQDPLWAGAEEHETMHLPRNLSLTLTVEVARVQMPLEQITQLQPGNILHLATGQEPHVYLTVEGKQIAKGELVQLGNALGVKILKLE